MQKYGKRILTVSMSAIWTHVVDTITCPDLVARIPNVQGRMMAEARVEGYAILAPVQGPSSTGDWSFGHRTT